MCSCRGGAAMALTRMLILIGLLLCSHADIPSVTKKEHKFDIIEHDGNGGAAPKNELSVVTTQHNSLDLTQNNNGDNTHPARNDGVLGNEPPTATTQQNSLDLTQNNNGHNTNTAGNDEEVLENEPRIATAQQNSLDRTQNNNGHNTCPARNDGVLENEPTTATTQQNSWNLTQNNNEDHTNTARNGEGLLDNEPTIVTRHQNSWNLTQYNNEDQTNTARNYGTTTLPLEQVLYNLHMIIRASAGPLATGEFQRSQVAREFPGNHPTQHGAGELPLYWAASRRGIARTSSRLGISTPHELARAVGNLVLWWGTTVMLSGFVSTLQVEDLVFIALICFVLCIRIKYLSIINCHSRRLFFATTCGVSAVLSAIRLASQHFGETREAMETRNLASNVFYVMALTEALVNLAFIAYYYVIRPFDNESQE